MAAQHRMVGNQTLLLLIFLLNFLFFFFFLFLFGASMVIDKMMMKV